MAIGRVAGSMLVSNQDRQGVDLQFTTNNQPLFYMNFSQFLTGINTNVATETVTIKGNLSTSNVLINGLNISAKSGTLSITGPVSFPNIANVTFGGGSTNSLVYQDSTGKLAYATYDAFANIAGLRGNTLVLGANSAGLLSSNAVAMTTNTTITDGIARMNQVLGKLVPPSPPPFPNGTLTISSLTSPGRMCSFTQTDNTGNGWSVAGGTTLANVLRTGSYTTNTLANVGPGESGTITTYLNGVAAGSVALTGTSNGTYGNLIITNNQDYKNVWANVAAGFWYSFSAQASGTITTGGYNGVYINHSTAGSSNTATWYYDNSAPGTPTFSNTSITLTTNSVSYSSTIPHLNTSAQFRLKGNVAKLSGDMYYSSDTFITGGASGALSAPVSITYTQAGVTTPLARNLYVSSGSAYFETTSNVTSGFGYYATNSPTLTAFNSYTSGAGTFTLGTGILFKTGTATNIEETSIPVTSVGTGSGNAYRIVNPGSTDTPTYAANGTAFNSQTGPFYTYDATNVGSGSVGIIKWDQTNYSTGYYPVGPNLSTQATNQYFTFKFIRTAVSKFDIVYSGTIAGMWVALPGSTIDSASSLNGWLDMGTAYAGAGVPGANTGSGGNGSNGCALGGNAVFGSAQTNKAVTATFGTASSSSTATNEIYVRIKFTSGQSLTALSLTTASH